MRRQHSSHLLFVMKCLLSSGLKEFSDPIRLCEIPQYQGVITKVRHLFGFLGVFQRKEESQNEIWTREILTKYLLQDFLKLKLDYKLKNKETFLNH